MSKRYRSTMLCPECGLLVAATAAGNPRSHARLVVAAGIEGAACVVRDVNPSRRDESAPVRVAEQYREQTVVRLYEERDYETRLPKHLRD